MSLRLCGPGQESSLWDHGVSGRKGSGHLHGKAQLSQLLESCCVINLKHSILKAWDSSKLAYKNKNTVMVKMR